MQENGSRSISPDSKYSWIVLVAAFTCGFFVDGSMYTFGLFLEDISNNFNTTLGHVTLISSVNTGFYYIVGPFISALVNRYGFRKVAFIGGLIAAVSYAVSSFANSVAILVFTNGVCAGTGLGMIYAPSAIVVGFYFEKWRAVASGIATCGSGIGTLALPPLLTYVMEEYHSWRVSYYLISGFMVLSALISLFYRPIKATKLVSTQAERLPSSRAGTATMQAQIQRQKIRRENEEATPGCSPCCLRKIANRHFHTTEQIIDRNRMMIQNSEESISSIETEITVSSGSQTTDITNIPSKKARMSNTTARKSVSFKSGGSKSKKLSKKMKRCLSCYQCRKEAPTRPMYRDDIFFHHSLMLLPQYQKTLDQVPTTSKDVFKRVSYHMSVTRATSFKEKYPDSNKEKKCCRCSLPFARTLTTMLDITLLKSPTFHLFAWSGMIVIFGYMVPFLYIKDRAIAHNIDADKAVWLLSTIGLANTFGRIISGILPSLCQKISVIVYSCFSLVVGGTFTVISGLEPLMTLELQFVFAAVFGWAIACIAALRPVIAVELFGLENLTNAFGLQMMFQGVGSFVGMFVAGVVLDETGNYHAVFAISGGCIITSGILLIFLKPLRQWELRRGILVT